ncbi:hypothetical protein VBD025_10585 [Virgibacillus flavescens]|uniref:hypothetical protein n=1 Tax=Virgibacillus flavescens TaxID=1611422 RepID=UPI003D34522D
MNFFKKSILYIILLLVCASVYNDLMTGSVSQSKPMNEEITHSSEKKIIRIQILPGDNVLSVTEKYNSFKSIDIERVIEDFKKLNPHAHPYQLEAYKYYYFPLYQ